MYSRALESKDRTEAQYAEDTKRSQQIEDEQRKLDQARTLRDEEFAAQNQQSMTDNVLKAAMEPTKPGEVRSPMLAGVKTPQDAIKLVEGYMAQFRQPTVTPQGSGYDSRVFKNKEGVYTNVNLPTVKTDTGKKHPVTPTAPPVEPPAKKFELGQQGSPLRGVSDVIGGMSDYFTPKQQLPKFNQTMAKAANRGFEAIPMVQIGKVLGKNPNDMTAADIMTVISALGGASGLGTAVQNIPNSPAVAALRKLFGIE
jgi:hypothetical protein